MRKTFLNDDISFFIGDLTKESVSERDNDEGKHSFVVVVDDDGISNT